MADPTQHQSLKTKEYETIYILRGDVDADTAEKVQARVSEVVARESGKMTKVEAWGRRKLAYPVAKQKKGVYVFVKYVGQGGLVQEVERNLKLQDSVLKFQTVMTQHDVKGEITVDPEEVKMARLELPVEEEEKESRERSLGLLDNNDGPRSRSYDREDREEEFTASTSPAVKEADDDGPNSTDKEAPAATPSSTAKDGDK